MEYGCIGEHLTHSFSKEIHNKLAPYSYELCEVEKEKLDEFMIKREFRAINVTIPYKQAVIPHLFYIDETAEEIGAVNTIVNKNGRLYGYNTDFAGMCALSEHIGINFKQKKVLILGTGGTSKTATALARCMGAAEIIPVSRTKGTTYEDAKKYHSDAAIIINTTPCGMYPDNNSSPVDLDDYPMVEAVMDVIYNPLETKLVKSARERGIKADCGLYMLVAQAAFAIEIFIGTEVKRSVVDRVYKEILMQKQNIVLTGMPASGKTTTGKLLADMTGRRFIDTDAIITERYGCISEIFEKQGEKIFRDMETEIIKEVSKNCGIIIATGGGAILRKENIDELKANGRIFFLDRPLEYLIPTEDRPLSRDEDAIKKRYTERYSIYNETADVIIKADDTPEKCAEKIIKEMI